MAKTGRQFVVELITKTKDAQKGLDDFGKSFTKFKTPVLAGLAAVAAGFVAITAAAYKTVRAVVDLGTEFNNAYRTLQAGTGATGDELARLEDSFLRVFGNGADSMEDVAAAMVEIDRRFDTLSNRRLERLTRQFLDLSGLVGEDTVGIIEGVTGAFNRFNVPAHMASDTLDTLFRISQETGYSLSTLGSQTENYGVGLQRLGFNLEEAAAFLALLDREGVAASRIFPSLNTAAGKLAREGVGDVAGGIAELITQLRTLDEAEANAKAVEMLGADYGNFLSVVRSTNFDYQGLLELLGDSEGVISATAAETDGLTERWNTFKNFLKVQLEPVARTVFDALSGLIDSLRPAVERIQAAFESEGLQGALEQVHEEWDRIYEDRLQPLFEEKFLPFIRDTVGPLLIEAGKVIGSDLATALWNGFSAWMSDNWVNLMSRFSPLGLVGRLLGVGWDAFKDWGDKNLPSFDYRGTVTVGTNTGGDAPIDYSAYGIPQMAAGGVVMSPTLALIGEAGPEAVIPLSEMNEYGGQTVINITVNGGDPQAVVDAIRRYTRSNGPLGQAVAL